MLMCRLTSLFMIAYCANAVPSRPVAVHVEGVRTRRNFDSEFGGETNVITKVVTKFVAKPNSNACSGLPYGVHGHTCSPTFIVALPNVCSTSRCRPGYVFDEATQQCMRVEEVGQCHGTIAPEINRPETVTRAVTHANPVTHLVIKQLPETATRIIVVTEPPVTATEAATHIAVVTHPATRIIHVTATTPCDTTQLGRTRIYGRNDETAHCSCRGRDIGVYPIGCSRYYCSCRDGVPTRLACPEPLVFDDMTGQCRAEEYVPVCGGVQTTTAVPYVPDSMGIFAGRRYYSPY